MFAGLSKIIFLIFITTNSPLAEETTDLWRDIFSPSKIEIYLYEVEGDSLASLKQSMLKRGPVAVNGKIYFAQARWLIDWKWPVSEKGPQYLDARITQDLKITIPYYNSKQDSLNLKWNSIYENIIKHELQHLIHGHAAAMQIRNLLILFATESTYPSSKIANEKIDKIINDTRNLDIHYDKQTNHGASEGVVL